MSRLPEAEQRKFIDAMGDEWCKWEQFKATYNLTEKEIAQYIAAGHRVVGTRWVLTYKDAARKIAKARLVVQGCQEANFIRSDAPTGSTKALCVVCHYGAQRGWRMAGFDAATAYLQPSAHGPVIDRTLLHRLPRTHPPPGRKGGQIVRASGAIYGTRDAGRKWYLYLRGVLQSHGFVESRLEKGMYRLHHRGKLVSVIHTHVDDFILALLDCDFVKSIIEKLTKELYLKRQNGCFLYCGRVVTITPSQIRLSMPAACRECAKSIIEVPAHRRKQRESTLSLSEKSSFRKTLGCCMWTINQVRLDCACEVNRLAQKVEKSTIQDLLDLHKAAEKIATTAERAIIYHRNVIDTASADVMVFGDASFADLPGEKSQIGVIAGFTHQVDKVAEGAYNLMHITGWQSGSAKRVVRSTLAAEAYASSEALELGVYLQMLVDNIQLGSSATRKQIDAGEKKCRNVVVLSDSNSVVDATLLDSGTVADKRLRIVIAMLRLSMTPCDGKPTGKEAAMRWVNTHKMLGDGLTKVFPPFAPALVAAMAGVGYKPPPGKAGRAAVVAARSAQMTTALRLAIGACAVPRAAQAAALGAAGDAVAISQGQLILTVFVALLAGWILANIARIVGVVADFIRFVIAVCMLIGRCFCCCCRGRRPGTDVPERQIGAVYGLTGSGGRGLASPLSAGPARDYRPQQARMYEHPVEQLEQRCRGRCDMHSELLAPSDRCVNMCSLDHGHEFDLVHGTHACRQCLASPRFRHFLRIETPGMKCRDVAVQLQTTHSFVAGAQHPRFKESLSPDCHTTSRTMQHTVLSRHRDRPFARGEHR